MELQKVVFEDLILEITRRCNLKCAHCAKGDAQNLDMSKEIMDRILEQTEWIGTLRFTGGEPTLNMEGMRYFLEQVKQRNIGLNKISIITNGTNLCNDFILLMKEMYDYIDFNEEYGRHKIVIKISDDRFHSVSTNGCEPEKIIEELRNSFVGMDLISVGTHKVGEYPKAYGRAHELTIPLLPTYNLRKKKIEVMSKDFKGSCPYRKLFSLKRDDQYDVICQVIFTAKGAISSVDAIDFPYNEVDAIFSDTVQDFAVVELIKVYNFDAIPCAICNKIEELDVVMNNRKLQLEYLINGDVVGLKNYNKNLDAAQIFFSKDAMELLQSEREKDSASISEEIADAKKELVDICRKVFNDTYLLGIEKEKISMDDFVVAVYSELDEFVKLRIKTDSSEDNVFNHVKRFFVVKFSNIIKDFFVKDVIFFEDIRVDIQMAKNLVRRNIAYAKCFLEILERIPEKYRQELVKVEKIATTIINSTEQLLNCDMYWMNYVNSIEEFFLRPPVYSKEEIEKEGLKNIDKVIKTEKLIIAMEEVKNRLGEIFDEE